MNARYLDQLKRYDADKLGVPKSELYNTFFNEFKNRKPEWAKATYP